ncbi:sulfotransferase [Verrucomicrobiaceae bacterium N1E253]|uniref:Sulfotransferase n=1 Tax=Oceaniferula marina TaxID=2748318 RepID=A0A851GFQ5_9BACT|nr:sulfotransferase [Oceaniferula marina]NWK55742.1 sulfotransferase [Oceaniferula marina]
MRSKRKDPYYQDGVGLQEAREMWNAGDYTRALRLFERISKREPYNLKALQDTAYAFGQHFEIDKATRYIKRMEHLVGNDPGALHVVADAWTSAYRPQKAMRSLERAIETGNARAETYLSMAMMEERSHRLENAMGLVNRYLFARPNAPDGLRLQALILRRQGEVEQAKVIYQSLRECCGPKDQMVLAQGLNDLAQIHDKEQDYETAMTTLAESKLILQRHSGMEALLARERQERHWFDRFLGTLTPGHIEEWVSLGVDCPHNQVILTGCPRSGTTLIEKVLDAHTGIVSAEELGAFPTYTLSSVLRGMESEHLHADSVSAWTRPLIRREVRNYYRYIEAGIGERIGGRVLVDKIPSNTMMIPLMVRMIPSTRVLYALRDPRDIIISCYFCWMEQNSVSVCFNDIEKTVQRTICELQWWQQIKELLPEDRWRETKYENAVDDLMGESQNVIEWMGLTWEKGVENYRSQIRNKGVTSPTYEAVSKPVYRGAVERWRNYEKHMAPHLDKLEPLLANLGY